MTTLRNQKLELITDPRIFGPGLWYGIHITAWYAKTEEEKRAFVKYMEHIRDTIQCLSCRDHCASYMEQNPISDYWNQRYNDVDVGMFKWTFNFHNAVNQRLNKPIMDWSTAYNLYSKAVVSYCSTTCGSDDTGVQATGVTFKSSVAEIQTVKEPEIPFASTRRITRNYGTVVLR